MLSIREIGDRESLRAKSDGVTRRATMILQVFFGLAERYPSRRNTSLPLGGTWENSSQKSANTKATPLVELQ